MLAAIFDNEKEYWDINKILNQEDDVELEDEEQEDEEQEDAEKEKQAGSREKTPDLTEDIFKDDENIAIAECF
jgi:hypothetical protein